MSDLSVEWAGLTLKNPVIVAASSLGNNIDKLKRLEAAGAGAVTTKVMSGSAQPPMHENPYRMVYRSEGWMLVGEQNMSLAQGVALIAAAKQELTVPVIANTMQYQRPGSTTEHWIHDCLAMQEAGADAVELDLYPAYFEEGELGATVAALIEALDVPVLPKLNPTCMPLRQVAEAVVAAGAETFSMSNCFWGVHPGVDIADGGRPVMALTSRLTMAPMSGRYLFSMQNGWLVQLKGMFGESVVIGSGGGLYAWEEMVQRIMLGASTVQLCSTIYENGPGVIGQSLEAMRAYMDSHGYATIEDLRGLGLAYTLTGDDWREPAVYEPAVARIVDRAALAPRGAEVVEKVQGDCLAMYLDDDDAPQIDEAYCTGCGWCVHHAGNGVIELAAADRFVSDLDVPRLEARA